MIWNSKYFTFAEMTHSDTAIRLCLNNTPGDAVSNVLSDTAERLDAVRELLGNPVTVNSGYRGQELNARIGGVSTSAHTLGYAADIVCPAFGEPLKVAQTIRDSGIKFDQLICEGTWVHISFDPRMRQQCLTAHFQPGKPAFYSLGLGT